MKKSMKAALLSALVFPGVGHIFVKKYIVGVTLAGTSFLSLYYILSKETERALQIVEKIQLGEVPPDISAITDMVSLQTMGSDTRLINIASILLFFFWVIGIIDSYMVGRKKEDVESIPVEKKRNQS